jgi:hypothetical protein
MAMSLMAMLVERGEKYLKYRVFTRKPEDGENLIISIDDLQSSYTEGFDRVQPRSRIMGGRIWGEHEETGVWPERNTLQA